MCCQLTNDTIEFDDKDSAILWKVMERLPDGKLVPAVRSQGKWVVGEYMVANRNKELSETEIKNGFIDVGIHVFRDLEEATKEYEYHNGCEKYDYFMSKMYGNIWRIRKQYVVVACTCSRSELLGVGICHYIEGNYPKTAVFTRVYLKEVINEYSYAS